MDVADLPRGRREEGVALVPFDGGQIRQRRREQVDRVLRELRIGDVALHTLDGQAPAERAAPAVLDHVAAARERSRLADDAVVELLTARLQRLTDDDRAVVGRAFLVAGQQQRNGERRLRVCGQKFFQCHDEGGDRGLHVAGAAPIQATVAQRWCERVALPLVERASRHDVGMAGKHQQWGILAGRRPLGPQVGDAKVIRPADDGFADEAQRLQTFDDERLTQRVVGGQGRALNQLSGQFQGAGHRHGAVNGSRQA